MAISKRLRFEVLRRDGHRCHYCGATPPDAKLTVDHVTAVALGGTDTADNLVTACEPCNSGKSATPAGAPLIAAVRERDQEFRTAVAATAEDDRARQDFADAFLDAWDDANGGELPPGWAKTIEAYRKGGMTPHMWAETVSIAMERPGIDDRFRYCCGVARRKVENLQDRARQTVAPRTPGRPKGALPAQTTPSETLQMIEAAYSEWVSNFGGTPEDQYAVVFLLEIREAMREGYSRDEILDAARATAWDRSAFLTLALPLWPGDDEEEPGYYDHEMSAVAPCIQSWLKGWEEAKQSALVERRVLASLIRALNEGHPVESLSEAAYLAGLRRDPAIPVYLGQVASQQQMKARQDDTAPQEPRPLTEEEYERGNHVLNIWASKWESMNPEGPTKQDEAAFLDELVDAIRAGHERDSLLNAADLAGGFMDTRLSRYLPLQAPQQ